MNRKILVLSIPIALLFLGGWFVFRQYERVSEGENFPKGMETLSENPENTTPPVSKIDTSNWKTYRNEEYGFEVKYPEGWEMRKEEEKNKSVNFLFGEKGKKYGGEYGGQYYSDWVIILSINLKNNPLLGSTDSILKRWRESYNIQTQEIIIDGTIAATRYTGFGDGMLISFIPGRDYEFSISSASPYEYGVRDTLTGMEESLHFF